MKKQDSMNSRLLKGKFLENEKILDKLADLLVDDFLSKKSQGKQVNKYYIIDSNTESNIHDIVYFNAGNKYFELSVQINAGGLAIERFVSNFKFTN